MSLISYIKNELVVEIPLVETLTGTNLGGILVSDFVELSKFSRFKLSEKLVNQNSKKLEKLNLAKELLNESNYFKNLYLTQVYTKNLFSVFQLYSGFCDDSAHIFAFGWWGVEKFLPKMVNWATIHELGHIAHGKIIGFEKYEKMFSKNKLFSEDFANYVAKKILIQKDEKPGYVGFWFGTKVKNEKKFDEALINNSLQKFLVNYDYR